MFSTDFLAADILDNDAPLVISQKMQAKIRLLSYVDLNIIRYKLNFDKHHGVSRDAQRTPYWGEGG